MSDIFEEVDDDLRQDRMREAAKRYGGIAVAVAVMIVAATAGFQAWRAWRSTVRQAATIELAVAAEAAARDKGGNVDALNALVAKGAPGDVAQLAKFDAAASLARAGKTTEALAIYDGIGSGSGAKIYRDAATIAAALLRVDTDDPAALAARLEPLALETSPWRHSAREMLALLAARSGDAAKAGDLFKGLSEDTGAPAGTRARAAELATLYKKG